MCVKRRKKRGLTEAKKMRLEEEYLPVESNYFNNVIYAVERQGKGLHIISGSRSISLDAEDVDIFTKELGEVWETMRPGV